MWHPLQSDPQHQEAKVSDWGSRLSDGVCVSHRELSSSCCCLPGTGSLSAPYESTAAPDVSAGCGDWLDLRARRVTFAGLKT
jgi:hypothetical protein